jgi:hypothetical protein
VKKRTKELAAIKNKIASRYFGVVKTAKVLDIESSPRPQGRPKKEKV